MTGRIHSLESMAAVDGAGLRYAVFMTGCPLKCAYCHNPDTRYLAGEEIDAETLVSKIKRYKSYFGRDGGVTFSGGEPLLQADFINSVAELLRREGIGYILDTSGAQLLTDSVKRALRGADSVLLDLKFPDDESYIEYTGRGMVETVATLKYLNEIGKRTVIRTVIVPGINDTEEWLDRYLDIVRGYDCAQEYELLGFHTMGFFKYEELGIENRFRDKPALPRKRLDELRTYLTSKFKK